jgi:hypothetical protein
LTTWERCKPFLAFIKAAVQAGLPPKQVIFEDPSHTEYDFWDLRLLKAFHFAESFVNEGIPIWWDESDDVTFDVERRVSRSRAATDRAQKQESSGTGTDGKPREAPPGRYYVPVPRKMGGGPMPTFSEYVEEQERKKGKK